MGLSEFPDLAERDGSNLTYALLASCISPSFWNKFTEIKLNIDKLKETERHIWGSFSIIGCENIDRPLLEVDSSSFNLGFSNDNLIIPFHGKLINKNTIQQFKDCDKSSLIVTEGQKILEKIENGRILDDPSLLNTFLILSFADLKKYYYYYWFAFPVPSNLTIIRECSLELNKALNEDKMYNLYKQYESMPANDKHYFLIYNPAEDILETHSLKSKIDVINEDNYGNYYFAFYSIASTNEVPGSQLRNYILFLLKSQPMFLGKSLKFLAIHLGRSHTKISLEKSVLYRLKMPDCLPKEISWVGWEKNEREKMGPRLSNMKHTLDPLVLTENAVDLNLKLMKWNIMPDIDLEKIKKAKCLLLGAGTLGCSVARTLLGWGVRNITFVDNATVSYSNPVRQSLFTFQDSLESRSKALAAAESLRNIFPGVNSEGFVMNIPMPSHPVGDSLLEQTKEAVEKLTELIKSHDIVFLLMDSRESRWLPTLLGTLHNKIVINAALGFDTYLVMRHGARNSLLSSVEDIPPEGFKLIKGDELGCYFCNDVTAPGNSLKDRTLDQQCTVTRPGISQIAGALAAELAVSVLLHKDSNCASAFYKANSDPNLELCENQCILGLVPHSLRGFLSSFNQVLPASFKYKNCTACSEFVLNEYEKEGFHFLLEVFKSSKHLENVAGITKMLQESEDAEIWEFSDDE